MGMNQMSALTGGKKYRPNYVSQINAQVPYLPALYSRKKEDQWRDKTYGLEKERFEQDKTFQLAELDLAQDAAKQAKKQTRLAEKLGYANLGVNAALGGYDVGSSLLDRFSAPAIDETGVSTFDFALNEASPLASITKESAAPESNWLSEGFNDFIAPIKKLGSGAWDFGKGLFDSITGSLVDFGSSDATTDYFSEII